MSSYERRNSSSTNKTVLAICNRCKEKLRINIDLEELKQSLKGAFVRWKSPTGILMTHIRLFSTYHLVGIGFRSEGR